MAEYVDLTSPEPTTSRWYIKRLDLQRGLSWDPSTDAVVPNPETSTIRIILMGENSLEHQTGYNGQEADDLLVALNTVDLSAKSLHRRVLERLVADGKLDGAVTSD